MAQSFATSVDLLDRSLAVAMSRLDSNLGSFISMASQRGIDHVGGSLLGLHDREQIRNEGRLRRLDGEIRSARRAQSLDVFVALRFGDLCVHLSQRAPTPAYRD